jgi:hypothetical protein
VLVSSSYYATAALQSSAFNNLMQPHFHSCSKLAPGVDHPPFHPSSSSGSAGLVLAVLDFPAALCEPVPMNTVCCLAEVLAFALVANTSIASLNLSLLVNSVGFYQASQDNMAMPSKQHWAGSTTSGAHQKASAAQQ